MSTATLPCPAVSAEPAADTAAQAQPGKARLLLPYVGYVGYFVGAGLISGGIVHYPLDPDRYAKIAVFGVAVFLAATVLNEVVLPRVRLTAVAAARLVGASLLLSLGIGMLSGCLQHFADFPQRAASLIPVGLVLSFLAYLARHAAQPLRAVLGVRGAAVVLVAAGVFLALQPVAAGMAGTGTGHAHGSAPVAQSTGQVAGTDHAEHGEPDAAQHAGVEGAVTSPNLADPSAADAGGNAGADAAVADASAAETGLAHDGQDHGH